MVWFLLAATLIALLVMEVRIWRAGSKLIYRTGRGMIAKVKQKDGIS